jgi:hypothetical protein
MNLTLPSDVTGQISALHIMCCMTLAEVLQRHVTKIQSANWDLPQYLCDSLEAKGLGFLSLERNIASDLAGISLHSLKIKLNQTQDSQETKKALSGQRYCGLKVDYYTYDFYWKSAIYTLVGSIMSKYKISDRHHNSDVLLNQN